LVAHFKTKKMGKDKIKVCEFCGKYELCNWKRHWKQNHTGKQPCELKDGNLPTDPFCVYWFTKIPESVKKLYPKTQSRLGGSTAQKNPAEIMKSL
jgi:hypothetical protein